MLDYFSKKRAKKSAPTADQPVLSEDDELWLQRILSDVEGHAPELPPRPQTLPEAGDSSNNERQIILAGDSEDTPNVIVDAHDVPLPKSPDEAGEDEDKKGKGKEKDKKSRWSLFRRSSGTKRKAEQEVKEPAKEAEAQQEADDIESVMEQLNLAAVNNRVFSASQESKDLLHKFTLVLKDLVNGVPTAYDDLEKLLTNSEDTLDKTYKAMPHWMQELVGKLPAKMQKNIGPELLATAAAKHGIKSEKLSKSATMAEKAGVKVRVPSLKELVTKQGAIVGLLKAIMNFLRTRFPAVLGVNVLWSLAITLLLLVFWYCHKRGKEVRLEKERKVTEAEMEAIRAQVEADPPADYDPSQEMVMTTTAAPGADLTEVQLGMAEVRAAREAAMVSLEASQSGLESSLYAPEGSLAQSLRANEDATSKRSVSPLPESSKKAEGKP